MPISYAERKKRRQALLQRLAPALRERLALRHVEAVAKLPLEAQHTLAMALSAGSKRIPAAIEFLREQPQASLDEVLQACGNQRCASPARKETSFPAAEVNLPASSAIPESEAMADLAGLLQGCFPGMPEMTAKALAADELLHESLVLVRAGRTCLRSTAIRSELVFVVLCGWSLRFIGELNRIMNSRPHYRGALSQSGLVLRRRCDEPFRRAVPGEGAECGFWPFCD